MISWRAGRECGRPRFIPGQVTRAAGLGHLRTTLACRRCSRTFASVCLAVCLPFCLAVCLSVCLSLPYFHFFFCVFKSFSFLSVSFPISNLFCPFIFLSIVLCLSHSSIFFYLSVCLTLLYCLLFYSSSYVSIPLFSLSIFVLYRLSVPLLILLLFSFILLPFLVCFCLSYFLCSLFQFGFACFISLPSAP